MCSVEKVLSHKYDWHVRHPCHGPSVRSNCTRTYNFHHSFWLSYPPSLALHSSSLSYGLQEIKEILLCNVQSCSLKQQEKYGSSWGYHIITYSVSVVVSRARKF